MKSLIDTVITIQISTLANLDTSYYGSLPNLFHQKIKIQACILLIESQAKP